MRDDQLIHRPKVGWTPWDDRHPVAVETVWWQSKELHLPKLNVTCWFGGTPVQTVNARDLHAFLQVGSAFKDWIARRIDEYGFQEGKDFCSFLSESSGGRPAKEYAIGIDMAKELAMVERNDQGKRLGVAESKRMAGSG